MFKNFSGTRFIGSQVIYLPKCHSTNDLAAEFIREGKSKEGLIIISDYQSSGRGQGNNTWDSEDGKNLTFSIILTPQLLKAHKNFMLGMAVIVGIYDGLDSLPLPGIRIKWPNDIYYDNKKLGGILIENIVRKSHIGASVAGIGINVNQERFTLPKAISLRQIRRTDTDREKLFESIIYAVDHRYGQLHDHQFYNLRKDYNRALYRIHENCRFRAGEEFTGRISGVDDFGRLIVATGNGSRAFDAKEIEYLDE